MSNMFGNELHVTACIAGVTTWIVLNRHPLAGDTAVAVCVVAFATLYFCCAAFTSSLGHALPTSLSIAGCYGLSALCATLSYRLSPWHPLAQYPGPRMWHVSSMVLSYYSFHGKRHLILNDLHARYGPFLRIGPDALSINSLSAQYIYSAKAQLPKAESYRAPGHSTNVSLFFKQPTEKLHADRKRIWSAMFTREGLSPLFPILEKRTSGFMRCLEQRTAKSPTGSIDITECFYHWSFDFMGDMAFGGANQLELMKNGDPRNLILGGKLATRMVDSIGQTPWLLDIIWHLPMGGAMHRMRELAAKMVQTRLNTTDPPPYRDLMSYLADKVSVPDMEWDAIIAILGGSDNTSITMALAVYFLITEPRYWLMLREEVECAFPTADMEMHPDELAKLPFLEGVIQEALRLGSPYYLPRVVRKGGVCIDECFIPEGTTVALAAYSQQIDPANFFPDPLEYRPERWLPNGLGPETRANKSAINSFSFGPHVCIAKAFAYQEMRYMLARLVTCMEITPAIGFDAKAFRNGIMNMRTTILKEKLVVYVKRRPGAKIDIGI